MIDNFIAITIGDINGIGLEILYNTWKKNKFNKFILFTNSKILEKYFKSKKIKIDINIIDFKKKIFNFKVNKFNIYSFEIKSHTENTYESLKHAYNSCINKYCIGIITLPLRKDLIINEIDSKFIGHTEYFQKKNKKKYSNMILYHKKIIVSTLTTHIKVNKISKLISKEKYIYNQILNLNKSLKVDLNISSPKLIVSGFNPHAGENGRLGKEETNFIKPAIDNLSKKGILVDGPISADSMLIKKNLKKYDCFIFMYHDQALIPFKYISQFSGVNYTGNLDIIRTSPDHGTAYKMKGSKEISNRSFINCYKLIKKIYKNRMINEKS